jgi:hypothetical protein
MVTQQPKGNALRGLMPLRWSILILLLRPQGLLGGARSDLGQRV